MIVLTTTYNCENFVERSLLSIMSQRFKNFTCYITDDMCLMVEQQFLQNHR